jgi:hypothetical protein
MNDIYINKIGRRPQGAIISPLPVGIVIWMWHQLKSLYYHSQVIFSGERRDMGLMMTKFGVSELPNPEGYLPWTSSYIRKYIILFKTAWIYLCCLKPSASVLILIYPNSNYLPHKQFTTHISWLLLCITNILTEKANFFWCHQLFFKPTFYLV